MSVKLFCHSERRFRYVRCQRTKLQGIYSDLKEMKYTGGN
jgi:hypothetical protein